MKKNRLRRGLEKLFLMCLWFAVLTLLVKGGALKIPWVLLGRLYSLMNPNRMTYAGIRMRDSLSSSHEENSHSEGPGFLVMRKALEILIFTILAGGIQISPCASHSIGDGDMATVDRMNNTSRMRPQHSLARPFHSQEWDYVAALSQDAS